MRATLLAAVLCGAVLLGACRGEAQNSAGEAALARLVDSLRGPVERATALKFTRSPRSAMRTRAEVRQYLIRKLDQELPPARLRGLEQAYRLFGLLPDTLELRSLLVDLYTEQVAGYYDPDSATLFGVSGADRSQLRLVLAHELVHALQGQHMALDSILHDISNNDRLSAAQAILEGQATLASIEVLAPEQDIAQNPEFWELYREQVRQQQSSMPVFAHAPLIIRDALIFPYLQGAEFMHWWEGSPLADTVPYGPRMPASTEQILHPERYQRGDRPVALGFRPASGVTYEDVLGESEIRVLIAVLAGSDEVQTVVPIGWGGDRYRVYEASGGHPALVWYIAWDDAPSRERFLRGSGAALRKTGRAGYRATFDTVAIGTRAGTRYVLAPTDWNGWGAMPGVAVR